MARMTSLSILARCNQAVRRGPQAAALLLALQAAGVGALTISAAKTDRASLHDLFFMRCGPGWTGGDTTYSLKLGTGEVNWLFSDSFYGRVANNGSGTHTRTGGEFGFVGGNSLVRQRTNGTVTSWFRTSAGAATEITTHPLYVANLQPNPSCPAAGTKVPTLSAYFRPTSCGANCLPWMGAPFLGTDGRMRAFVHHHTEQASTDSAGEALPAWTYLRSTLSRLALSADGRTPAYASSQVHTDVTVPSAWSANLKAQIAQRIRWGGAVLRATVSGTDYLYVYGTRLDGVWGVDGIGVYLARVPAAQVEALSAWRFWGRTSTGGTGFVSDQTASLPLGNAVSGRAGPRTGHSLGVMRLPSCGASLPGGCYVMLGHDRSTLEKVLENNQIVAWYATSPQGPWSGPVLAYTTPESRHTGPGADDRITTYDSTLHNWSLSTDGRTLLVSYNVNWLGANIGDPNSPFVNADNYRPRFVDITFNW